MSEVLFVSSSNMGLSRVLEGLLRQATSDLTVLSADISIDDDDHGLGEDAQHAPCEVGARCDGGPYQLTPLLVDGVDVVIVVGRIDASGYIAPDVETGRWEYDDPADRGIYGYPCYVQLRDFFTRRVNTLAERFTV